MIDSSHKKFLNNAIAVLLLFLYIFDFELIKGISYSRSSVIAIVISLLILLFSKARGSSLSSLFRPTCMRIALALSSALVLYTVLSILFHYASDYSLLISIARSVVWIGATAVLYVAVKQLHRGSILDLLIDVMIAQSVIIVFSMLFPDFKSMTDAFRSDSTIERGEKYSGYRALGLSGSAFFGLAICYGFSYLLIAYHWREWNISNPILKVLIVILLVVAGSSAGRTSQIGLIVAILLFVGMMGMGKMPRNIRFKKKNIVIVSVSLALVVVFIPFLGELSISGTVEYFVTYATSFFANFNPSDILSSTSSTQTLSTMYFPLSFDQLIAGDGLYEINGSYYMGTDAGYMRTVLYFGVLGLVLMCAVQFSLLYMGTGKREMAFFLSTVLLLLVFQYKGEAIMTPVSLSALMLLAAFDVRNRESGFLPELSLDYGGRQLTEQKWEGDFER